MPCKPAKMIRFLKKNGFIEIFKQSGHRKFYNPTNGAPMHNKELQAGTEKAILEEASLQKR